MKFSRAIPFPVEIRPTANGGFTATVGCEILAYSDAKSLIADLTEYLTDSKKVMEQRSKAFHEPICEDVICELPEPGNKVEAAGAPLRR